MPVEKFVSMAPERRVKLSKKKDTKLEAYMQPRLEQMKQAIDLLIAKRSLLESKKDKSKAKQNKELKANIAELEEKVTDQPKDKLWDKLRARKEEFEDDPRRYIGSYLVSIEEKKLKKAEPKTTDKDRDFLDHFIMQMQKEMARAYNSQLKINEQRKKAGRDELKIPFDQVLQEELKTMDPHWLQARLNKKFWPDYLKQAEPEKLKQAA